MTMDNCQLWSRLWRRIEMFVYHCHCEEQSDVAISWYNVRKRMHQRRDASQTGAIDIPLHISLHGTGRLPRPYGLAMTYLYVCAQVVTVWWSLRWWAGHCPAPTGVNLDTRQIFQSSPKGIQQLSIQFSRGNVKVNSVFPSKLVTEIFSPWRPMMVFTM